MRHTVKNSSKRMLYDAKSSAHLSKMELFYLSTADELITYRINKSTLLQVVRQTGSSAHFGLLLGYTLAM